ncbi:MAG: Maf family protein [Bacteroidota bacterium]
MLTFEKPLILASQSPRRKQLLEQLGLNFDVIESNVHEIWNNNLSEIENVRVISLHKAESVARQFFDAIIISADTVVSADGKIFGKPTSSSDAIEMLQELSGKTHTVHTGYTILHASKQMLVNEVESTFVTFRNLEMQEITDYVESGAPMDKAGAYGIQEDFGAVFVERINGDYYNVVGLPLHKLYLSLKKFSL